MKTQALHSLKYYSKKMIEYKDYPHTLNELLLEMSHDYGQVSDETIPVRQKRMEFFIEHKKLDSKKPLSDTILEAMWMRDGDGQLEERQKLYLRGLEKIMSNVKAFIRQKQTEMYNN